MSSGDSFTQETAPSQIQIEALGAEERYSGPIAGEIKHELTWWSRTTPWKEEIGETFRTFWYEKPFSSIYRRAKRDAVLGVAGVR